MALGRRLPFVFFAGKECRAIRELGVETRPARGGAMATQGTEAGRNQGTTEGDGDDGQQLNPEKGLVGASALLRETAKTALRENFLSIVECIVTNIRNKHLPSVKLLFELAGYLEAGVEVPAEAYESFAAVLWKEFQTLEGQEKAVPVEPDEE